MLDTVHVLGGVVGLPGLCALYALVSMLAIEINRCDVAKRVVLCTIDAKGNADLPIFAEESLPHLFSLHLALLCLWSSLCDAIYMVYMISNAKFLAQLRFSSVHWFINFRLL